MRIYRCPRCRAEDISADAHPTRLLAGGQTAPVFVCRSCYRAAELEFRIACETQGLPYAPLSIREGLRRLAAFYRERLAEWADGGMLVDDVDRESALRRIRAELEEVDRKLMIAPVE